MATGSRTPTDLIGRSQKPSRRFRIIESHRAISFQPFVGRIIDDKSRPQNIQIRCDDSEAWPNTDTATNVAQPGGAPVSDPAFRVQDRAAAADRRSVRPPR